MSIQPRKQVLSLSEAVHGGIDELELKTLGIDRTTIIDFSSNVNPFAPSPKVHALLGQIPVNDYPDRYSIGLRSVLAEHLDVSIDRLVMANGSSELLWLIALTYLQPGHRVVIVGPTYSEYARSAQLMGAEMHFCNAKPQTGFVIPVTAIEDSLQTIPRILYLCNPNNPTGKWTDTAIIERWAHDFPHTLFVIDEAYIEFAPSATSSAGLRYPNIVVLRSMTKAYGLAGLRLGYLIADPEVVQVVCSVRIPWSVNVLAQQAGIVAIQDQQHKEHSLAQLVDAKRTLVANLESIGLRAIPSATAFFLVPVRDAKETRATLIQSRILVRDCSSFGLPDFIRIATQRPDANAKLVDALRAESRKPEPRMKQMGRESSV